MGNTKTHQQSDARDRARIANDERVAAWRLLTPAQQIASLDSRLGVNIGATKQRRMINARIS
jgi:hypothetical protein